jgi:hypothetical protein
MTDMSQHRVKLMKKDTACEILHDALRYLEELSSLMRSNPKTASNSMKHQMLESQKTIIELQSELLDCKNEQLKSLQNSVKSSVGESVKPNLNRIARF